MMVSDILDTSIKPINIRIIYNENKIGKIIFHNHKTKFSLYYSDGFEPGGFLPGEKTDYNDSNGNP